MANRFWQFLTRFIPGETVRAEPVNNQFFGIEAALKDENGNIVYVDFMEAVIQDWDGVEGADGALPYTAENWRALAKVQGIAQLAWLTYMRESGAKEKN